MSAEPRPDGPALAPARAGQFRWVICALLFFAATINYIDRQVIGILKPTLVDTFVWKDERIYSSIVFCFQLAYAIGFLFAGRVMDAIGVRRGFAISVTLWSLAAMAHGLAGCVTSTESVRHESERAGAPSSALPAARLKAEVAQPRHRSMGLATGRGV